MRVLITGGAGFIGSSIALALAERHPDLEVLAADNLYRRGSELNLPRLREAGVAFHHADVRHLADLEAIGQFDALVECSAEPSVMASVDGGGDYVVQANLIGAYHCLEAAARQNAQLIFLSTSRVYPVAAQEALVIEEGATRLELAPVQHARGRVRRGHQRGVPARRRAHALRRDEARGRAADRGVPRRARPARGRQSLRRRRRAVADGQGRPGRLHALDAELHVFDRPLSYIGYGGTGQAGPRPAARRRPRRSRRRAARRSRALGRLHVQRRRWPRRQPLAAGDDGDLPRADRPRPADRQRSPRRARATCRSTSATARRCSHTPPGVPAVGRATSSATSTGGSSPTTPSSALRSAERSIANPP